MIVFNYVVDMFYHFTENDPKPKRFQNCPDLQMIAHFLDSFKTVKIFQMIANSPQLFELLGAIYKRENPLLENLLHYSSRTLTTHSLAMSWQTRAF